MAGGAATIALTMLPLRNRDAIVLRITSTAVLTCTLGLHVTEERGAPIDSFAGVDSSAYVSAEAGVDGRALTLSVRPIGRPDVRVARTRLDVHPATALRPARTAATGAEVTVGVTPGAAVYATLTVTIDQDEPTTIGPWTTPCGTRWSVTSAPRTAHSPDAAGWS